MCVEVGRNGVKLTIKAYSVHQYLKSMQLSLALIFGYLNQLTDMKWKPVGW